MFVLCLSLFSIGVHSEPNYENYNFNFTSGTNYSTLNVFLFSSNWTNTTKAEIVVNDSETNFTLGRPDGSISVYNLSTIPLLVYNTTTLPAMLQIIFTQGELGSAGTYNYSFGLKTANSSDPLQTWSNTTPVTVFTIGNGSSSISLYLNGLQGNMNYQNNTIANFTATLNVSGKNIFLDSNCTTWNNLTNTSSFAYNETNLTCLGLFFVKAYWNGDENYSESSRTYYFDTIAPQYLTISPASSQGYVFNSTYWFNISVVAANVSNVTLELNGSLRNVSNSSGVYWFNVTNWPAGNYTYRWNITNYLNVNSTTDSVSFNITKAPPVLSLTPNLGWIIYQGASGTVTCTKGTNSADANSTLTLYRNVTTVYTDPSLAFDSSISTLPVGTYNYTCTIADSQNYSYNYLMNYYLTIISTSSNPNNPSNNNNQPSGSFSVTTSSSNVTMEPNSSKLITITLGNTFSYDITSINLTVSGINSSWYGLDKTSVSRLQHNIGVNTSTLTLTIPNNAEQKSYTVIVTVVGRDFNLNRLTRQTSIFLTVYEQQNASYEINETNATNETNESNETAAVESQSNGTAIFLSIFSMTPQVRNIIVFVALMCIALILIFKDNITRLLFKTQPHVETKPEAEAKPQAESKTQEAKKLSLLHPIKAKIHSLSEQRLVIQIKKKEKKEEKA
jgi:hypothetical protein